MTSRDAMVKQAATATQPHWRKEINSGRGRDEGFRSRLAEISGVTCGPQNRAKRDLQRAIHSRQLVGASARMAKVDDGVYEQVAGGRGGWFCSSVTGDPRF